MIIYDPHYDPDEDHGSASAQVHRLRSKDRIQKITQKIRDQREEKFDNTSAQQERFNRLIRNGIALEIRNALLETKRGLDQHEKLGRFTKTSLQMANEFRRTADGFLKRKLLLEQLENGIETLRSKLHERSTPALELKLKSGLENAQKIKNDCIDIAERLIVYRERIEQQVAKDLALEESLKHTIERCLEKVSKQERGKFLVIINQKKEQLPIDQRISFFSQLIQQFAKKIPAIREEQVERLYHLAEDFYSKKHFKEALRHLDDLFKFEKAHLAGHRMRAQLYQEMGNPVAFLCELRMIIKIPLAEGRDFFALAKEVEPKNQEEAYGLYEDAVSRDPCTPFLEKLADLSMEMNRWPRAVQLYQQILKTQPFLARVMHKYGRALLENRQEDQAFDILRQAIQMEDNCSVSRVCVARIYRKRSAIEDACESFRRAIELDPDNVEANYWWGAMLLDQGDFEDALMRAQKTVQLNPDRVRNRLLLARCLGAVARYSEAVETLKPCLAAPTPSVDVILTFSEMCRHSKNEDQAIEVLEGFLKRFPRQPQIRNEYGLLLVQVGRFDESQEYLDPNSSMKMALSA